MKIGEEKNSLQKKNLMAGHSKKKISIIRTPSVKPI